jgi:carboxypeptidase C (cathepsin A)
MLTTMKFSSGRLATMIQESGAKKIQICKKLEISRSTLDHWLKPGNDHLLDLSKVMKVAEVVRADPGAYFPGIELELQKVSKIGQVTTDAHVEFLMQLVNSIVKNPHDAALIENLKQEILNFTAENIRYRDQLTKIMHQLNQLK